MPISRRLVHFFGTAAVIFGVAGGQALAQDFPNQPIRVIVPAAAGGGTDILARLLEPKVSELLGTPVIVENQGGGDGLIGAEAVVRAKADGYTLLFSDSSLYLNSISRANMPFDALVDLKPVMRAATGSLILFAHPSLEVTNLDELVTKAKAEPGAISYATGSTGAHLLGALFEMQAGVDLLHIPYRGGGPAMTDVIGGHVPLTFNGASNGKAYVESGEILAIGATGTVRNPSLPDTPTFEEQGYSGFPATSEWGLFAPAATPQEIVDAIHKAYNEAVMDPAIADQLANLGFNPDGTAGAEYSSDKTAELELWRSVAEAAGIKPE